MTASVDEAAVLIAIQGLAEDLARKALKPAADAAARFLERKYRDILVSVKKTPQNTGIPAFEAVESKTGVFSDLTGVWIVVGTKVVGGRHLAPQAMWGESGTTVRTTKSGANRGIMPPQGWLDRSVRPSVEEAKRIMLQKIESYVNRS